MYAIELVDRKTGRSFPLELETAQTAPQLARLLGPRFAWRACRRPEPMRPLTIRRQRRIVPRQPSRGPVLYVANTFTHEIVGTARNRAGCIELMSRHVPNMEQARTQFRICTRPPAGYTFSRRREPKVPFGKYAGCRFTHVPWQYLDRLMHRSEELDPGLAHAIHAYLSTLPEWQDSVLDEHYTQREVNHLRDFVPSEFRS